MAEERERDSRAVRAQNDMAAAWAEFCTSLVLVSMEDVMEFLIQAIYVARTDGLDVINDPLTFITTVGTLAHMVRQLNEARQLYREIPALRRIAECRDKQFDHAVTDDDVVRFAEDAGTEARLVNLSGCRQVSDVGITAVARQCPHLGSMDCSGTYEEMMENVTDDAVVVLAEGCRQLRSVNFAYCMRLTDTSVVSLAEQCRHLASVNFEGCEQLTDKSVISLSEQCLHLTSVRFAGCRKLTEAGKKKVSEINGE